MQQNKYILDANHHLSAADFFLYKTISNQVNTVELCAENILYKNNFLTVPLNHSDSQHCFSTPTENWYLNMEF